MTAAREPRADAPSDVAQVDVMLAIVDFPMLSAAFRAVIDQERDMGVVVEATNRESILLQARAISPAVIILEYEAFAGEGVATPEAIEQVRAAAPDAKIIALDCRCATEQFAIVLKAGANGFLTREALADDVVSAVRAVAAGHTYDQLSDRERQILLLAAMGHTNRDIARSLHLSEQTVHYNRANLMEKLGLHDRVELLRFTVRRGLLTPSVL